MPESLFAPRRFRHRYLACCALAALTLESSVVGIAQIWPQDQPPTEQLEIGNHCYFPADNWPEDFSPPNGPPPTSDELTPPPEPKPTPEDTPPLDDEPEMLLDTPNPSPSVAKPPKATRPTGPIPPSAQRGSRFQPGMPGGIASAVRTSGPLPNRTGGKWRVSSKPPYPAQARASHVTGSGTIRLTTDASGKVTNAAINQSSGSAILDGSIASYAKLNWSGPPNTSVTVPFTYQLP